MYFFVKGNPSITGNYISGLVALVKEHVDNLVGMGGVDTTGIGATKEHFLRVVRHINTMKGKDDTQDKFATVDVSCVQL